MRGVIRDFLQQRLDAGEWRIGQVIARADFSLRHAADATAATLENFSRPEDARELAKYDEAGNYRPLKTAPNLRRGWLLQLSTLDEMSLALDFLYPAALGTLVAFAHGGLAAAPLRETLNRQTGMYRVTQHITDEQAREIVDSLCVKGCIRHRLWDVSATIKNSEPGIENSEILCAEACNLFVAACRPVAKQNLPQTETKS
jgi:sirohydrochlorin cobaltochelatase